MAFKGSLFFVLSIIILVFASNSYSSSCEPVTVEDAYKNSQHIFIGDAVKVEFYEPRRAALYTNPKDITGNCGDKKVTFKITESFKGQKAGELEIESEDGCTGLGGYFTEGKSYLVYVSSWQGKLYTSVCNRTVPMDEYNIKTFQEDLKYLRSKKK
jgi:hypothetical protein